MPQVRRAELADRRPLSDWMRDVASQVETLLERALPFADTAPERLHQAMRYAVLQGGKRIRPMLAFAAGEATGAPESTVGRAAVAVELIHAYSLVHDDLPCMDDDVLRRGKPTAHVAFGEATALLVGDALQSLAFEVLAGNDDASAQAGDHASRLGQVRLLAEASGSRGMAGGQAIDLASVGASLGLPELEAMHRAKTAALLRAAVLLGAGEKSERHDVFVERQQALERYAQAVGLAFQVIDDVLDVETETAVLGKTSGKDAALNKPTYVSIIGLAAAKELAERLRRDALDALDLFGGEGLRLRQLANFIVDRRF